MEQLDHACIRFIYFSKENELRSRVFAEKLGLEAGWNCHISLASEGNMYYYKNILLKLQTSSSKLFELISIVIQTRC